MVPGELPDISAVKLIEISAECNWENQEQLELPLFRADRKLSSLSTGTFQLSPLLDANLGFFMWHFGHFWAL